MGLPAAGEATAIVSLLGRKPDGTSEFSFYSFKSGNNDDDCDGRPRSFQKWLTERHPNLEIVVAEHPTTDLQPVDLNIVEAVGAEIERFLGERKVVVVVDSGGETRTRSVLNKLGFVEDPRS